MNSQLYTAASGLRVEETRVDAIANNLANLTTNGFRARRTFNTLYSKLDPNSIADQLPANQTVALAGMYADREQGPERATQRPLDVVLKNGDLLVVETDRGRGYTRAGSLQVDPKGILTDWMGHPVLDPAGNRIEGLSASAGVLPDGSVRDGDATLGRLAVVRDPAELLAPAGHSLLVANGRDDELQIVDDPELSPGWIEQSSTNAMEELVLLIQSQRAFQSYQKLISLTMNEVNRRTVNDIAG